MVGVSASLTPLTPCKLKGMPGVTPSVEQHPQRKKIIDMLLSGVSPMKISQKIDPPISHVTIWRYKRKNISKILSDLPAAAKLINPEALESISPQIAAETRALKSATSTVLMASPLVARAERLNKTIDDALLDEMASLKRDSRAVAALASAGFKGIESAARLEMHPGFVSAAPMVQQAIVVAVFRPGEAPPEAPSGITIDVEAEEDIDIRPRQPR